LVARTSLERIAGSVLTGDLGHLIGQLEDLDRNGKDMNRLLVELLVHFRNLLVVLNAGPDSLKAELGEEQAASLARQASALTAGRLLRVVEILIETEKNLRHSLSPRILLETALIRCARASTAVTLDEVLDRLTRLREGLGAVGDPPVPTVPAASAVPVSAAALRPPAPMPAPATRPPAASPSAPSATGELEALAAEWPRITERIGRAAPRIKALLTYTKPSAVSTGSVTLDYDAEKAADWPAQAEGSPLATLTRAVSQLLGRDVSLESRPVGGIRPPAGPAARARQDDPPSANRMDEARKQLIENPHVENVLKIFGGSIREIRQPGSPSEETDT
jgi:DNA polymerase III gamma/tau subunit